MTHLNTYEQLIQGEYYHIYNRGNNREDIFLEDKNYFYFLDLFKKYISPLADLYVYCLMKNHFHLLVKIKEAGKIELKHSTSEIVDKFEPEELQKHVSRSFSNFFNAYAKAINKMYNRTGSLFQERFRRKLINKESYFTEVTFYIHANPQRHGFTNDFRNYKHSSYQSLLSHLPSLLKRDEVMDWFGGKDSFAKYHEKYRDQLLDYKFFLEHVSDD